MGMAKRAKGEEREGRGEGETRRGRGEERAERKVCDARRGHVSMCLCAIRGEGVCVWRGKSEAWKGRGEERARREEGGAR